MKECRNPGAVSYTHLDVYKRQDPEHPEAEAISVLPYGGFYNRSEDQLTSYDVRNSFKYNKKFGLHDLNMIACVQVKYACLLYTSRCV